jgi:SAM-dependent methyltransferase
VNARNPPTQYADERNLRARQRLWQHQDPPFDLVGWVLDLAGVGAGQRVLDVGCGNGSYLAGLARRGAVAVGCDLSLGMLEPIGRDGDRPALINADAAALAVVDRSFDTVLAPHMLYHVGDRPMAAEEMRRVLRPGGRCVAVTNGAGHMTALRELVEAAAGEATPGWEMRNPSTHDFSLENGADQLRHGFEHVECVRPQGVAPARIVDASIAADYVASISDLYEHEVARPWTEVVAHVRHHVQRRIEADGAFEVAGDVGAFVCR